MYAVIFRAQTKDLDQHYELTAERMRTLAQEKYGCLEFVSLSEGDEEISISYWPDQEAIQAWKSDPEHQQAQKLGAQKWYSRYKVEVVRVERSYQMNWGDKA